MRYLIKDFLKCDELKWQFQQILQDEQKPIESYEAEFLINEAKYVRDKYLNSEDQWTHYYMISGQDGLESQAIAKKELRQINKFLQKWDKQNV
jgi:hypothetical protein